MVKSQGNAVSIVGDIASPVSTITGATMNKMLA